MAKNDSIVKLKDASSLDSIESNKHSKEDRLQNINDKII